MTNQKNYNLKRLNFDGNRVNITYRTGKKGTLIEEKYRICADKDPNADIILSISSPKNNEQTKNSTIILHSLNKPRCVLGGKDSLIEQFLTHVQERFGKTGHYQDGLRVRKVERTP